MPQNDPFEFERQLAGVIKPVIETELISVLTDHNVAAIDKTTRTKLVAAVFSDGYVRGGDHTPERVYSVLSDRLTELEQGCVKY